MTNIKPFGTAPSGEPVFSIQLNNGNLSCEIITFGATIRSLIVPDRNGDPVEGYKGIQGDLNKKVDAAYLVCTEHTKKDWDKYLKDHPDHNISTDQDKEEKEDKDNTVTPGGEDTPEGDQEET